jgi:hypothetical protein
MSDPMVWRKSRRCSDGGCVEVAQLPSEVTLRDSTDPHGPTLRFSARDWASFTKDLCRISQ